MIGQIGVQIYECVLTLCLNANACNLCSGEHTFSHVDITYEHVKVELSNHVRYSFGGLAFSHPAVEHIRTPCYAMAAQRHSDPHGTTVC